MLLKNRISDTSIAPYVKIKPLNKLFSRIRSMKCKSIFFYYVLCSKCVSRGNMESIFSREFQFPNKHYIWENVYKQKLCDLKIPKLCEFNFKLLHNVVPCGKTICKWQRNISEICAYCSEVETTKHMLFECPRIKSIWNDFAQVMNINIKWKHIVCGFPSYEASKNISLFNYVISIIAYSIFKLNSVCKFNNKDYCNVNIKNNIKQNISMYLVCVTDVDKRTEDNIFFRKVYETI